MADIARVRTALKNAFIGVLQLAFLLVIAFFTVSQCVGNGKAALACVGVGNETEGEGPSVRELDPRLADDSRLIHALVAMTRASGLADEKVRAAIVISPEVNAATFDEATFLFFEGLTAVSDETLDAIIAHEVAHAVHRHSEKASRRVDTLATVTSVVGTLLGRDENARKQAASWLVDLTLPSYSRDQELEADRSAVDLLASAGYGSRASEVMVHAMRWLKEHAPSAGGGFFDSHPSLDERIQQLSR